MYTLTNKRILLGVTGGIAAYKSADLVRQFQNAGAIVRVVMTRAAQEFITPLTLQALSGYPVASDLLDEKAEAAMGHIELARWADYIVIAPATANCIANLALGRGADLLSTLCLASRCSIAVAPAMNQAMWANVATSGNVEILRDRGVEIIGPGAGHQACGDVGLGRMLEPADIVERVSRLFESTALTGKKILITAGPTQESIDPVRYLTNHSSGKMGYALASAAIEAGAKTVLVSGPTQLEAPDRVELVDVVSALEMYDAVMSGISDVDIFIGAAAVADFRPKQFVDQKIKKSSDNEMVITLEKNPDIIAEVASHAARPYTVGFAAETENLERHAREKLVNKHLDLIIANDVSKKETGFNSEENSVVVFSKNDKVQFDQRNKSQLARDLIGLIAENYSANIVE